MAQPSASLADETVHPFTAEGLPRTLWWDDGAGVLRMIDQTRLPGEVSVLTCATSAHVAEAIRRLQVRGAPAIGVAAAYGLALGAREAVTADDPLTRLREIAANLRATRPTAVNLGWALDRLLKVAENTSPAGWPDRLLVDAHAVADEDAAACRAMGRLGAELIADGDTLLTHCNAGALATAGMGTALAPIFTAHQAGKRLHVYVDETRPILQGARLTAWELGRAGVPYTLIADNMAAHFLRRGGIRGVFVGSDRIAANGDVANKIGTYGLAILAREHGVPLYVVAPRSTVDLALPDGEAIPIEERAGDEITTLAGRRIAPADARVANPAFDVTPARYVAAIVTEAGTARPPFDVALSGLMSK
ncbi:MAG TPA: S-methyl-5-thioribose-1-phosphate isomerase [Ktedonobacterales bacterium]